MPETIFKVRVPNVALGIAEKVIRIIDFKLKSTALFRMASLSTTPKQIDLSATNDSDDVHTPWSFCQQNLQRIRLKKNAFTPEQQLIKPVMAGVGCVTWSNRNGHFC